MVAVLLLQNLSGDSSREFFTDGVTQEIVNHLAHVDPRRLAVIAPTSIMPYKNTSKKISQIGRELGADHILERSVREQSGRARITVQLIMTLCFSQEQAAAVYAAAKDSREPVFVAPFAVYS